MPIRSAVLLVAAFLSPALAVAQGTGPPPAAQLSSIGRFARVDAQLYRGAQPERAGFEELRALGVQTVISLREDANERKMVESLGMSFVHLPMTLLPFGLNGAAPAHVISRFFEVVDNPASGIVFVHCRHGKDRTGLLVSFYRIARQGWSPERAYAEARQMGMAWWHYYTKRQLRSFASRPTPRAETGETGRPAPSGRQNDDLHRESFLQAATPRP